MKIKYNILKCIKLVLCFDMIYCSTISPSDQPNTGPNKPKKTVRFSLEDSVIKFCPMDKYDPKDGRPQKAGPPYPKRPGPLNPYSKDEHTSFIVSKAKQTLDEKHTFNDTYSGLIRDHQGDNSLLKAPLNLIFAPKDGDKLWGEDLGTVGTELDFAPINLPPI